MGMEETIMTLVVKSGQARSAAYEALGEAKQGRYEEAEKKMKESAKWVKEAHEIQTRLLTMEARGEGEGISLIGVHAQDHLMDCILARELIAEMIELYKILSYKEDKKGEEK